jgi:hypothetical protein
MGKAPVLTGQLLSDPRKGKKQGFSVDILSEYKAVVWVLFVTMQFKPTIK